MPARTWIVEVFLHRGQPRLRVFDVESEAIEWAQVQSVKRNTKTIMKWEM